MLQPCLLPPSPSPCPAQMFAPPAKKARRQRYTRSADDDERSGAAGPSSKRAKAAAVVLGDEEELDYGNQTLPVGRLPPDFDGIPTDGEMYLAVVRQQAKAHPAVLTAPSNPYAVVQLAPAPAAAASERSTALPTQEWREQYVTRFKAMREVSVGSCLQVCGRQSAWLCAARGVAAERGADTPHCCRLWPHRQQARSQILAPGVYRARGVPTSGTSSCMAAHLTGQSRSTATTGPRRRCPPRAGRATMPSRRIPLLQSESRARR